MTLYHIIIHTSSDINHYSVKEKNLCKVRKKAKIKNVCNQVPHLTTPYRKVTKTHANITYKKAKRSAISQQVTTRLQETDNTVRQRQAVCQETQSKKEGKDRKKIQSSTTPDPGYKWESDNVTIRHLD